MQRREAGLVGFQSKVSFVPVLPESRDQSWRALKLPNTLILTLKTMPFSLTTLGPKRKENFEKQKVMSTMKDLKKNKNLLK